MTQRTLKLHTKTIAPIECLGETFPGDEARREHYLKLLAQKLKDPEFRKIEGFPIGKDEDILALSDPPYYTACPNPWLGEFIKRYGTSYDPKQPYHREPFAADVSEGKNHPIYQTHSYHTKVPHRAIMRYILHYTQPGDVVFDGFCGAGMTGVAAQLCGDRAEVQELGYRVQSDGTILNEEGKQFSILGARRAILNDLSPAATFIAFNYNDPEDSDAFERRAKSALSKAEDECGWMFSLLYDAAPQETIAAANRLRSCRSAEECRALLATDDILKSAIQRPNSNLQIARLNYTTWSEVFSCPECGNEVVFWDAAVSKTDWQVSEAFECPSCKSSLTKGQLDRAWSASIDRISSTQQKLAKQVPALLSGVCGKARFYRKPDLFDMELLAAIERTAPFGGVPAFPLPEGDKMSDPKGVGIRYFHQFYTWRNLAFLASYARHLGSARTFATITSSALVLTKMYRFRSQGGSLGAGGGPMSGTLYVPSLIKEIPAPKVLQEHVKKATELRRCFPNRSSNFVQTGSLTGCPNLPNNSADYLFVDPPFGSNIMYSELNFIWESWLRVQTNQLPEAIENRTQKKTINDYRKLMRDCFVEAFRILKPGHWMTVEFSNTKAEIWNAILSSLQEVGFVVANVSALDKKQLGFNAVNNPTSVKQDLVISAYKPNGGLEDRFATRGETEEGVWDFVRTHLKNLPVVKAKGGQMEPIAERDPRILYDRMVAFYVGHSTLVPLSSAEFQAGLAEKLPERDGMYFLSEQVNEYDKKRAQIENIGQLTIFVEDERSAINWLRNFLKDRPSVYSDITADFMQQLSASWKKWEARPELSALLDQNFLSYDGSGEVPSQIHGYLSTQFKDLRNLSKDHPQLRAKAKNRWYVPDPKKNVDVESLRNKKLLQEFWSYMPEGYTPRAQLMNNSQTLPGIALPRPRIPKGKKLKELRTEAVRVGFKHCYQQRDYQTILMVAEIIPDSVLNEDEQLQMIYDTAVTRTGSE
jgi:predicted RNA-binding Zn-ribbon protein involved in translation (DUF1610 family)